MKNYYEILEVSMEASKDDIKKSYRSLVKKYHPDRNRGNEEATKKFQEISEAYTVISDEKSREEYDRKLNAFNNKSQTKGKDANKSSKTNSNKTGSSKPNLNNLDSYFESFFGFSAKNDNINEEKLNKNKSNNPMDTTDIFESFFRKK